MRNPSNEDNCIDHDQLAIIVNSHAHLPRETLSYRAIVSKA
jgi:hypothetical protein